jgi:hypothetical protein
MSVANRWLGLIHEKLFLGEDVIFVQGLNDILSVQFRTCIYFYTIRRENLENGIGTAGGCWYNNAAGSGGVAGRGQMGNVG